MRQFGSSLRHLSGWVRRYWVFGVVAVLMAAAFAVAAPAWAAPPSMLKYQTVPRPTATPGGDPVATATPRPDDDDDDSGEPAPTPTEETEREVPVFLLGPEGEAGDLSATVTVATLNVREGPGTGFPVVGRLQAGDTVNVLWRNEDNSWWYICCIPNTTDAGWTSAQLLEPDFDRAASADLIPIFGTEPVVTEAAAAAAEPTKASPAPTGPKIPLTLGISLSPPFLSQGETGELVLEVANPNLEDAFNVELSDQLPPELELVEMSATGQGQVSEQTADSGAALALVRWERIPAGKSVQAALTVKVVDDLEDGAVFDNLAAARGTNATYTTGAITIGMPPVLLPDFQ